MCPVWAEEKAESYLRRCSSHFEVTQPHHPMSCIAEVSSDCAALFGWQYREEGSNTHRLHRQESLVV